MRSLAFFLLLLLGLCGAQSTPAEYGVNVHVSSSRWVVVSNPYGPTYVQRLNVVVAGKKYELETQTIGKPTVLALGDYKARLVEDLHKNSYESSQTYEFQFADGKLRKYQVVGASE
jgi:hypothetical protein